MPQTELVCDGGICLVVVPATLLASLAIPQTKPLSKIPVSLRSQRAKQIPYADPILNAHTLICCISSLVIRSPMRKSSRIEVRIFGVEFRV